MRVSAAGNMPLQGLVKPPAKPVVMIYSLKKVIHGFGDCFGDYYPIFVKKNRRVTAVNYAFRASPSAREMASVARLLESIRAWA